MRAAQISVPPIGPAAVEPSTACDEEARPRANAATSPNRKLHILASHAAVAKGIGPVNALDLAPRKDLGKYQNYSDGRELTDYRMRILNDGTEAVTHVPIENQDESGALDHGRHFVQYDRCIVSGIDDAVVYRLVKSGAPA